MDTSLTETGKQVTEQHQTENSEIQSSRNLLSQLQTELQRLEIELKSILLETKDVAKKIVEEEDTVERITHECGILETQNQSIHAENIKLKLELETERDNFETIVSRNNEYTKRIADKIHQFSLVENKLPFMIELMKTRESVRLLKQQKEEMILDLHNPGSAAVKQVQEEIQKISEQIQSIGQCINAKNKLYEQEKEKHAVLRKEIEVQKKRYDAVLKRLHSQLNKAQVKRRQYQWNIEQMEKTASSLRESLSMMQ